MTAIDHEGGKDRSEEALAGHLLPSRDSQLTPENDCIQIIPPFLRYRSVPQHTRHFNTVTPAG